jgi:hypothetical protein
LVHGFDFFTITNNEAAGILRIGGFEAGDEKISQGANGDIARLTFRALENANTELGLMNLKDDLKPLDEEEILNETENQEVDQTPESLSISSESDTSGQNTDQNTEPQENSETAPFLYSANRKTVVNKTVVKQNMGHTEKPLGFKATEQIVQNITEHTNNSPLKTGQHGKKTGKPDPQKISTNIKEPSLLPSSQQTYPLEIISAIQQVNSLILSNIAAIQQNNALIQANASALKNINNHKYETKTLIIIMGSILLIMLFMSVVLVLILKKLTGLRNSIAPV